MRIDEGDRAAVHADHTAVGHLETRDGLQDRGLAGSVGAEKREHFALLHIEADIEEHLEISVAHVDVAHLQHRNVVGFAPHSLALLLLLAQFGGGERDVAHHVATSVHDQESTEQRRRRHDRGERGAFTVRVRQCAGEESAEEAAHQEDVHAHHGKCLRTHLIRNDRRDGRPHLSEGRSLERIADRDERDHHRCAVEAQAHGDKYAVSNDEETHHAQSRRRMTSEQRFADASGDRNTDECARPRDGADPAATECAVTVRILEQKVERSGNCDERETEHTDAHDQEVEGANLLESLERGTQPHRRFGLANADAFTKDRFLFLTTTFGFAQ